MRRHRRRADRLRGRLLTTVRTALADAAAQLPADGNPRLEAEVLLAHVLGRDRAAVIAADAAQLAAPLLNTFRRLVRRRLAGEPVAQLTGVKEFWSLSLRVTPDVLVPRPETELLVEWGLEVLGAAYGRDSPHRRAPAICDLGTGSGAVALALARERPSAVVIATDVSPAALTLARGNAQRLKIRNVEFREGFWYDALASADPELRARRRFSLIVANPPYVAEGDPHLESLRFEPLLALASGPEGLAAMRIIVGQAPRHLKKGGCLLVEHGGTQGAAVRELMQQAGLAQVETRRDFAGHERVTGGLRP